MFTLDCDRSPPSHKSDPRDDLLQRAAEVSYINENLMAIPVRNLRRWQQPAFSACSSQTWAKVTEIALSGNPNLLTEKTSF